LRLIDSCITQLKAQGLSSAFNESKEEEVRMPNAARSATLGLTHLSQNYCTVALILLVKFMLCIIFHDLTGEGHKTRRCRRIAHPESYNTKYTTNTNIEPECRMDIEVRGWWTAVRMGCRQDGECRQVCHGGVLRSLPHVRHVRQPRPDSGLGLGGVPQEQNMLKGHLPRVIYHQVY